MNPGRRYDVAIIGSGFSGSLLAWILATRGARVAIVDPIAHPRMSVGESSTPIADFLLRQLATQYGLPLLNTLSTWGSWRSHRRDLDVGLKRGFSYYQHQPHAEQLNQPPRLLIAASDSDDCSDTHWMRRDVDQCFFQNAVAAGAHHRPGFRVVKMDGQQITCIAEGPRGPRSLCFDAEWIIDASGRGSVLQKHCGGVDWTDRLRTHTRCHYSHRWDVSPFRPTPLLDEPFAGDDAAQHHLLGDRGWMWLLRFASGISSVGLVARNGFPAISLSDFPGANRLLHPSRPVDSSRAWIATGRIQRWTDAVAGPRRLLLPTAAATVDPLHSTGISHGLAGVMRVAEIVLSGGDVNEYGELIRQEVRWIDRLVSTAYGVMHDFQRFAIATQIHIIVSIVCEERIAAGQRDGGLFGLHDPSLVAAAEECCRWIANESVSTAEVHDRCLQRLAKYNVAGLMTRPDNVYAYTATKTAATETAASETAATETSATETSATERVGTKTATQT